MGKREKIRGNIRAGANKAAGMIFIVLSCMLVWMYAHTACAEKSGKWGDLTWSLDENEEVLTFSGKGEMENSWDDGTKPWGKHITKVIIEPGITSVGNWVFYHCVDLESISIPDSVTYIGDAFIDCASLKTIRISRYVKSIDCTFEQCEKLNSITVDSGNSEYSSIGGILYNKNRSVLLKCPPAKTGKISIPETVNEIADSAFSSCQISEVVIPETVQKIGAGGFSGCVKLTKVNLPKNIKTIEENTFWNCESLKEIIIPKNITSICRQAFYGTGITEIEIPNGIKIIEDYTFTNSQLERIVLPEGLLYIENGAFSSTELKEINIPSTVRSIGSSAFSYCKLRSVVLPEKIDTLESYLFSGCEYLKSVTIKAKQLTVGRSVFYNCEYEIVVHIPTDLSLLEEEEKGGAFSPWINGAFEAALGTAAAISVSRAGEFFRIPGTKGNRLRYVFDGEKTKGLEMEIESIDDRIPEYVTQLTGYVYNQNSIIIPKNITDIDASFLKSGIVNHVIYLGTASQWNKVKIFGDTAGLEGLKIHYAEGEIRLPRETKRIEQYAFAGIHNVVVNLPSTVETIEDNAFEKDVIVRCDQREWEIIDRCSELGISVIYK